MHVESAIDAYEDLSRNLTLLAREMHIAGLITDRAVTLVLAHADQTDAALAASRRRVHTFLPTAAAERRPTIRPP